VILVDRTYQEVPKKTLEEAEKAFDAVNSRKSFVSAMTDFKEFMQNEKVLAKCKELSVKYPNTEKK
jgi:hypothetical protein